MPAKARAEWTGGDLKTGSGSFTAGDSLSGEFSFTSRFEDGPGANPEQLIGAAHASCFAMQVNNELYQAGFTPESITTDATVTVRFVDGAPTITTIALSAVGVVPGLDEAKWDEVTAAAKEGCIISRALAGVGEITLETKLES